MASYFNADTSQHARPKEVVVEKVDRSVSTSPFINIRTIGERRTVSRKYRKGDKGYRYNHAKLQAEDIYIEQDCLIDVKEKWVREGKWEIDEILWETARAIPPPEPKPPGFWAKLWARLTRTRLPKARLLKG